MSGLEDLKDGWRQSIPSRNTGWPPELTTFRGARLRNNASQTRSQTFPITRGIGEPVLR